MKNYFPLITILFVAAILLFANLGNQFLWQDEAETAVLAQNVLKYGYPRAFDGTNLVNPTIRTGYGPDFGWRYHPWGQFYITAFSFKTLGIGTFRARLPFALIGFFNLILLYVFAFRATKNRFIANAATLLVSLSVPYLLLMRQCRYYAPAVFLVLCILIFYLKFVSSRSKSSLIFFAISLAALGHTVHGMYIPLLGAVLLHYFVFCFDKKTWPKILIASFASMLAIAPWFVYSNSGTHVAVITMERIWKNLEFQIRMINKYIIPVFFFLGLYGFRVALRRKWKVVLTSQEKSALKIIGAVVVLSMSVFLFVQERNFRYLIYFVPLLAIVQAMILLRLARFNRYLFISFLALSLFTNCFNMFRIDCYLPKYLYEITHDYDGPIEGIVKFLWSRSEYLKKDETVKIVYGDLPVMFYTDFKVDNVQAYDPDKKPKWIIFRRWWDGAERIESPYFQEVQKTYTKHVLDYPDIPWENRPGDLGYHKFSTDKSAPGVIIFERKD